MVEIETRVSPLAALGETMHAASSAGGATLCELPFLSQLSIRGSSDDTDFLHRVEAAIGLPLPIEPTSVAVSGDVRALWLGPDEWLIVGPDAGRAGLLSRLAAGLSGKHASVADVSASRTVLDLTGPSSRATLEKGCHLDLHPRSFGARRCAGTIMARTQVLLEQTDDAPAYRLYVRSSFARHLAYWLMDAMAEFNGGEE